MSEPSLLKALAALPRDALATPFRKQVAAICFRRNERTGLFETALVTSRGTGRWIVPKGWPMKGKKPHRAAEIEAFEEAGLKGSVGSAAIGRYVYIKDGRRPIVVTAYPLHVKRTADRFREKGQREIAWMPFAEAAAMVDEPELAALLRACPTLLEDAGRFPEDRRVKGAPRTPSFG